MDIQAIKLIGREKKPDDFHLLLAVYNNLSADADHRAEAVSSIGRYGPVPSVLSFIKKNYKSKNNTMDMVYQMYRTCLRNHNNEELSVLMGEIEAHYVANEVLEKMKRFRARKLTKEKLKRHKRLATNRLYVGDNMLHFKMLDTGSVGLVFTSPPYYNAREYSAYKSYADYLNSMAAVLKECHRILEDGRLIVINVSPVISKRPGREFESTRYPIHFDFHRILTDSGFDYVDDITWLKSDYSVPNRNAIYCKNQVPLSYKPNVVTESVLVYRKRADFLIDENILAAKSIFARRDKVEMTSCWKIEPKRSQIHPAIFPEELCERVLHYYSFDGDTVIDPFAGSCTVGRVAEEMGRKFILMEQNERYTESFQKDHPDVVVFREDIPVIGSSLRKCKVTDKLSFVRGRRTA